MDSGWTASGTGSEISLGSEGIILALTAANSGVETTLAPANLDGAVLNMVIVPSAEFIASGAILQPFAMVMNTWKGNWCNVNSSQLNAGQEQTLSCTLVNEDHFAQTINEVRIGLQAIVEMGSSPEITGTLLLKAVTLRLPETSSASSSEASSSSANSSAPGDNSSSSVSSSSSVTSSSVSSSAASASSAAATETVSTAAVTNTTHTISFIHDCGQGVTAPTNGYSFIGDYNTSQMNQTLSLGNTWNHLTNGSSTEWANTKLSASAYAIPSSGKANLSCNNVDTLDVVLVKKYANWDRQHANGFQPTGLKNQNINFGKIASLVIDLKIHSARTVVPTTASLVKTYTTDAQGKTYAVSESTLTSTDQGYVNLGFTLNDDGGATVLSASDVIEINQAMFADQWIRVVIDLSKVKYCSTTNYYCTAKTAADLASVLVNQLSVVAETSSGGVLRGSMPSVTDTQWNSFTFVPETFKELDISIKRLEFIYK